MRVPLSWLADYVEIDLSPEQLAERLTLLGMEVKAIERWGADWQNVVVGELLAVEPHPNSDRLSLARVTVGDGAIREIVCGATNIAAGQRVPVALPGAVLPGGRRIERAEKLGVVSDGMLCSGDELRLTTDAEGILILPSETPVGRPLAELFGDVVLDVDVKPNRGDCLSLIGLAREVAAVTGAQVRLPRPEVAEEGPPVEERLTVRIEEPLLCPRFVGRWVDGVRIGPSPDRVQMRLLAAGMRPVSNVVDASNYVMLELGKPIHTFDAAAVEGGRIIVRRARPGETLETLDHEVRTLDPETLLIADPRGPLAIAGVMGGAASEVTEATRSVIVESAIFDPVSIRRTAFRYALRSEASLRFEKGQEFGLAPVGADRTAQLIVAWAGGTVARGRIDTNPREPEPVRVPFRPARVNRLLGTELPEGEQRQLLDRVGVVTEPARGEVRVPIAHGERPRAVVAAADETLVAVVPPWRRDLAIEADIAEEIARVRGYERIAGTRPDTPMPPYRRSPLGVRDAVRSALVGAGLAEVVTHALVAPEDLETYRLRRPVPSLDDPQPVAAPIRVTNPLSSLHSVLRHSLLPSLVGVVLLNVRRGRSGVAIFEIGKGYGRGLAGPLEWWRLGIALTGPATRPSPLLPRRSFDLDDAKGLVEHVAAALGFGEPRFAAETEEPLFHPGRTARVEARLGPEGATLGLVGIVGELHPARLEALDVRDRLVLAELAVRGLGSGSLEPPKITAPPRHPTVERDLAVVVGETTPAARVAETIRAAAGPLLRRLQLFDVYRGAPLADGERSLAYRLTFWAEGRTLTEEEIEAAVAAVTAALEREVGGRLRS
jgi:phenylalanyl-tRNA synthetase beta chain